LEILYAGEESWLRQVPAVETLRQIWIQHYYREAGKILWRKQKELPPCAILLQSPYDLEARWGVKRNTGWLGYKVHVTESCETDSPHLIVDVQTRPSTEPDKKALALIQESLAQRQLLPDKQLVDMGYVTADQLLRSREEYGIDLVGKVQEDNSWQARQSPDYALARFAVDWEAQQVTCPQGKLSSGWSTGYDGDDHPIIHARFATADCRGCPARQQCTRAAKNPRSLTFRDRPVYEALAEARERQETQEFWDEYKQRAGIEGAISQAVRAFGLRRTRYIGSTKTHLQHLLIAAGVNFIRLADWYAGTKRAKTRTSRFFALRPTFCT
jgi:transposase